MAIRHWLGGLLMLLVLVQPLFAQSYPTRSVKIIVQFPPGGVPDFGGRLMAKYLTEAFDSPFVVENRTGAGGNIATNFVAKAPPDGYTLLFSASSPLAISPAIYKQLPFDPVADFKPITMVASFNFVMLGAPAFAPKTIAEIVTLARANPGKYSLASSGFGTEHHLAGELFSHAAGIKFVHIPYKGFGPATIDTMANNVELMFGSVPASMSLIKGGKLRPIATTGPSRDANLPEVPSFAEAGYPQVKVVSWVGLLAPAGTPKAIYDELVTATSKIVQLPEFVAQVKALGLTPAPIGPSPMAERLSDDLKFWDKVVTDSHIAKID